MEPTESTITLPTINAVVTDTWYENKLDGVRIWYVMFKGHSCMFGFRVDPEFTRGDRVNITFQKEG